MVQYWLDAFIMVAQIWTVGNRHPICLHDCHCAPKPGTQQNPPARTPAFQKYNLSRIKHLFQGLFFWQLCSTILHLRVWKVLIALHHFWKAAQDTFQLFWSYLAWRASFFFRSLAECKFLHHGFPCVHHLCHAVNIKSELENSAPSFGPIVNLTKDIGFSHLLK